MKTFLSDAWNRVKKDPSLVVLLVSSVLSIVALYAPLSAELKGSILSVVWVLVSIFIGKMTTAKSDVAAKTDNDGTMVAGDAAPPENGTPVDVTPKTE